jgi:hypothetical protein
LEIAAETNSPAKKGAEILHVRDVMPVGGKAGGFIEVRGNAVNRIGSAETSANERPPVSRLLIRVKALQFRRDGIPSQC